MMQDTLSVGLPHAFAGVSPGLFKEAVSQFGESMYLYDGTWLRHHVTQLRSLLTPEVELIYSVKANPNIHLVKQIAPSIQGVEVSSEGELAQAVAAGLRPETFLLVGPAKSRHEIEFGIKLGVRAIVIESMDELHEVLRACDRLNKVARLLVRINPDFKSQGSRLQMSSASTQFGVEYEEAVAIVRLILTSKRSSWSGIHIYTGTRILDADAIVDNCRRILRIAERIATDVGQPPKIVDFGGGLGVPYFSNEQPLDVARMAQGIGELLREHRYQYPETAYIMESGRYIVAESGIFLTTIRRIKRSKGATWVLTAGGTNQFSAPMFMGSLLRRNFPMEVVTQPGSPPKQRYHVCGPLCTPSDILGWGVEMPALTEGDLIAVRNAGAYGYSSSALGFLSHGAPAEVMLDGGRLTQIRKPTDPCDMIASQEG